MEWWQQLSVDVAGSADLPSLLVSLVLVLIMGQLLAWHYVRYARVLSNKRRFARIFVFISATTLLIITVVKTSLALSLGLVGALSIIRFRTPIKEPEELAYLFLAIAVGVGFGADQGLVTIVIFTAVLVYLAARSRRGAEPPQRSIVQVGAPLTDSGDSSGASALRLLMPAVEGACTKVDLRRVDCHDGELHASLMVELPALEPVAELMRRVQDALPGATISIIDQDGLDLVS